MGEFQLAVNILKTVLDMRKDWAIATFKRITDLDGKNTLSLFNLGEAYFASRNKKEAQKINDKLKKLDPAMSARLGNVLSGKIVIDSARQKVDKIVPKVPRLPRFP